MCRNRGHFLRVRRLRQSAAGARSSAIQQMRTSGFEIALRFPVRKLNRVMARYRYHPLQRDRQRASISRDWERMVRDLIANEPLDGRTRRYARSGIFLARHRYADPRRWWTRTKALYGALFANPAAVTHPGFPKRELLPGREPIWKQLSRAETCSWLKTKRHMTSHVRDFYLHLHI